MLLYRRSRRLKSCRWWADYVHRVYGLAHGDAGGLARRKAKQTLPIFIGLGIFWLTCIASPVNDCMRYFLPIAGCLPLIFSSGAVFLEENAEKSA